MKVLGNPIIASIYIIRNQEDQWTPVKERLCSPSHWIAHLPGCLPARSSSLATSLSFYSIWFGQVWSIWCTFLLILCYSWATVKLSEDQFSREGLKMTLDMHETLYTDMAPPRTITFQYITFSMKHLEPILAGSKSHHGWDLGRKSLAWMYHLKPVISEMSGEKTDNYR